MSSTELYYITKKNRVINCMDFRNSWLGAMCVWANLYKAHFAERIKSNTKELGFEADSPITDDDYKAVWGLFKKEDVPEYEKAVLGSTFDNVILEKEQFKRFYDDVLRYCIYYQAGTLLAQAQFINTLSKRKTIRGVAWNQTSVNADTYYRIKKLVKSGELWSLYKEIDKNKEAK